MTATILDSEMVRPKLDRRHRLRRSGFSKVDKVIAHALLNSSGRVTAMQLHMATGLPIATLQRRRKRLESQFMKVGYDLKLNAIGHLRMDLIVASGGNGNMGMLAERLLNLPFVSRVSRIFGTSKHNLLVEVLVEAGDFGKIAKIVDTIRSIENIHEVQWFIDVEEMGENEEAIMSIIDAL